MTRYEVFVPSSGKKDFASAIGSVQGARIIGQLEDPDSSVVADRILGVSVNTLKGLPTVSLRSLSIKTLDQLLAVRDRLDSELFRGIGKGKTSSIEEEIERFLSDLPEDERDAVRAREDSYKSFWEMPDSDAIKVFLIKRGITTEEKLSKLTFNEKRMLNMTAPSRIMFPTALAYYNARHK